MQKNLCVQYSLLEGYVQGYQPHSLKIVPIGAGGITPDRFAIEVKEYDVVWRFPVQWRAEELDTVRRVVERFDWSLSFEDGTPIDIERIYEAFEELLGSGANYASQKEVL